MVTIDISMFSFQVQVTEWEEEIACLRQQLEEQERSMEMKVRMCEEEWRARLDAAEKEEREVRGQLEELRWKLREGDDFPATTEDSPRGMEAMAASASSVVSSSPRKDLEPGWVHPVTLPRCFSQSRLSTSSSSSFTTR